MILRTGKRSIKNRFICLAISHYKLQYINLCSMGGWMANGCLHSSTSVCAATTRLLQLSGVVQFVARPSCSFSIKWHDGQSSRGNGHVLVSGDLWCLQQIISERKMLCFWWQSGWSHKTKCISSRSSRNLLGFPHSARAFNANTVYQLQ